MFRLHIANKNYSSWSLRPWLVMRELAIPFEERLTPFEGASNWDSFRTFSPSGKVPCLVDGETVVWDSLAIVEYLAEKHEGVWPSDARARAWARCASAEMHSGFTALRTHCSMTCGQRIRLHEYPDALKRDVDRLCELWRSGLESFGGPFLAGRRFSAVDAYFAPVAFRVQSYELTLDEPCSAYVSRVLALDGMREWYEAALDEPWRDEAHEAAIKEMGTIVADLRRQK
ncbi:MAG TPA: glutathione S-transferase family protein [Steroidobacter sp.]|jgi:glutathione S-transferase